MKSKRAHSKELGFKTPDDYLNNLEDDLMNYISLKGSLPKRTGFEIPESYFDSLTDTLVRNTYEINSEVTVRSLNWWYIISAAAAGLLFLLSLNLWISSNDVQSQMVQLKTNELENYLAVSSTMSNDFALEELFLDEQDLLMEINIENSLKNEELLDYLLNEIELNEIIIE